MGCVSGSLGLEWASARRAVGEACMRRHAHHGPTRSTGGFRCANKRLRESSGDLRSQSLCPRSATSNGTAGGRAAEIAPARHRVRFTGWAAARQSAGGRGCCSSQLKLGSALDLDCRTVGAERIRRGSLSVGRCPVASSPDWSDHCSHGQSGKVISEERDGLGSVAMTTVGVELALDSEMSFVFWRCFPDSTAA
ncbi:hypothetical protein VTI74DRAFT_2295 [Chaetomium olivicolor]